MKRLAITHKTCKKHHEMNIDDETIEKPECDLDPATVTAILLLIAVPGANDQINWKGAFRRLAVIMAMILPTVGKDSFEALAAQLTKAGLPTTRAALSAINVKLSDATGFHRSEKTDKAREAYRQRALKVWGRKGARGIVAKNTISTAKTGKM